ncbi:MAG: hypothetical protein L3K23_10510 [Thermoplasmata archaeon]|nr:hypothetical protein [Thermoplasmata archaeon]
MAVVCPKGEPHPARRVYVQVGSPKKQGGTGRSTSVALPFVFCGTAGVKKVADANGKAHLVGTVTVAKGQHGLVPIDAHLLELATAQRRRLAARGKPSGKAADGPAAAPGPAKGSKAAPKAEKGGKGRSRPAGKPSKGPQRTGGGSPKPRKGSGGATTTLDGSEGSGATGGASDAAPAA